MKAKNLIIVLLFIACFSFSQVKDSLKGWYFGPNISYSALSGYYFKNTGFDNSVNSNQIFYLFGIDAIYAFGRKHNLNFGIQYGERITTMTSFWPYDTLSNPNRINFIFNKYTTNYMLLPLQMNFCLFKGSISPYLITGFSPLITFGHKMLQKTIYMNNEKRETTEYYPYNELGVYWQFGVGVDVNIKKNKFRAFLYDSSGNGPVLYSILTNRYWDYSIHTGISYYFKK